MEVIERSFNTCIGGERQLGKPPSYLSGLKDIFGALAKNRFDSVG